MEKTLIQSTEELYSKAVETMKKKNADYSGDNQGMKNFELSSAVVGISMSKGILTRLMDKVTRIGNLMNKPAQVKEESIFDTIQDLCNYAAILHYAIRLEQEKNEFVKLPETAGISTRDMNYNTILENFQQQRIGAEIGYGQPIHIQAGSKEDGQQ